MFQFRADQLAVEVHANRRLLGDAAARAAAGYLRERLSQQDEVRVIFACAPSQDEFLAALIDPARCGIEIEWARVVAFHMDEYVGIRATQPQSFRHYLQTHLLQPVKVKRFHPLNAEVPDLDRVCAQYAAALDEKPIDLVCMGVGENGHIAFNDPPIADFADPSLVKIVELDPACRQQQVNDGCFAALAEVPRHALTLTVPVFRRARKVSIHVHGPRKAEAIRAMLEAPISPACPASILRRHPDATLHLDPAAAGLLAEMRGRAI